VESVASVHPRQRAPRIECERSVVARQRILRAADVPQRQPLVDPGRDTTRIERERAIIEGEGLIELLRVEQRIGLLREHVGLRGSIGHGIALSAGSGGPEGLLGRPIVLHPGPSRAMHLRSRLIVSATDRSDWA
jgi:hypothetical protein